MTAPPWVLISLGIIAAAATYFAARVAGNAQRATTKSELKSAEVVIAFEAYDELSTHQSATIARLEGANDRMNAELEMCRGERLTLRGELITALLDRDRALAELEQCRSTLN